MKIDEIELHWRNDALLRALYGAQERAHRMRRACHILVLFFAPSLLRMILAHAEELDAMVAWVEANPLRAEKSEEK